MSLAALDVRPAFDWCPPRTGTGLLEALRVCELAGLLLDPWQILAVDRILSEDEQGLPAAFEASVLVARQNGKGSILEALALYWLIVERVPLVLWTAHEFKTAREGFTRMQRLLTKSEDLYPEVSRILTGAGTESIEFVDGQRLAFIARSGGSGRGFTADKLILDEAYALDADEMAATLPTMATRDAAQLVYTSSAPPAKGLVLHRVIKRGRAGDDPSLAHLEFRAPGSLADPGCDDAPDCAHEPGRVGCALDRREHWAAANPGRVGERFISRERRGLVPERFARERLGWEDPPLEDADGVFPPEVWVMSRDDLARRSGLPVLAVDVAPDRRSASIAFAAAVDGPDGELSAAPMVQVVRRGAGASWVVDHLGSLVRGKGAAAVVLDGVGPAKSLLDDIDSEIGGRCTLHDMTTGEVADACQDLFDRVMERSRRGLRVRHTGQQVLDDAVKAARVRTLSGGRFAWDRVAPDADISPLYAVTLALWGHGRYGTPDQIVY